MQVTGEPVWRPVSSDPVLSRPSSPGTSGDVPVGGNLRLDIGWDRFEQLLVSVAGGVLGLSQLRFRRYGTAGQKQHGIDLAGRRADGEYTVVQAKEYRNFTPADLRKAVREFTKGKRPFRARHLVIAVSMPIRTTQVEDELAIQQDAHIDLDIELWGAEEINDELRARADIVARFWTRETAETFCTGAPLPGVAAPPPNWLRVADQTLRGPLGDEGLGKLALADAARAADPGAAAAVYGALADSLVAEGFAGHGNVLRHKQLDALAEAGQVDAVAALTAELAAAALHGGNLDEARRLSRRLDALAGRGVPVAAPAGPVSAAAARHAELIRAAVATTRHPLGDTGDLLAALRDAPDGQDPPYQSLLVLLAAEYTAAGAAIAPSDRRVGTREEPVAAGLAAVDDLIRPAVDRLTGVVSGVPNPGLVALRLQLVRAHYDTEECRALLAQARQLRLPRPHAALVLASQARREALDGSADEAIEYWRQAVEHAIHDGRADDARGWLYAIRAVNARYGPWTDQIDDEHLLAQALPTSTSGRLIRRVRDPENDARRAALDGRPADAIVAARRWLADSIVTGDWVDEGTAAELLGDLYATNTELERAAACYEWAGEKKKLTELAAAVGDRPLPTTPVGSGPWWRQTASLAVISAQHDLLDDDTARALLVELIDLVGRGRTGELSDNPGRALAIQATKSACALAGRGTDEDARALLDLFAADVAREKNHYHYHDREHVQACESIALHHPQLAEAALERIFDLAQYGADDALHAVQGQVVLDLLGDPTDDLDTPLSPVLTNTQRRRFRDRLTIMAADHYLPGLAVAELGDADEATIERAVQARDRLLNRAEPDGFSVSFGTNMVPDAYLVTFLDEPDRRACLEKMLAVAADHREAAMNRKDALAAASNLVTGMSDDVKASAHVRSRAFVEGDQDGSFLDESTTHPHPLSAFKIDMGARSLQAYGLRLSQLSAVTADDFLWVRDRAAALLGSDDRHTVEQAARTLHRLDTTVTGELDAGLLAIHPMPIVRRVAAVLAAASPEKYGTTLRALAADPEKSVRLELGWQMHAATTPPHGPAVGDAEEILALLREDLRHSVRRATDGLAS